MKIKVLLGVMALMFTAACAHPPPAAAQNRVTMLVMGEDADPDSIARDNRVFRRVIDSLHEQMNQNGFDVFDETAVTLGSAAQGRVRRTDAELISIARNSAQIGGRPLTVRVITTFQIYAMMERQPQAGLVRVRVSGRMLDGPSGRFLGTYEVAEAGGKISLSPDCAQARECVLEKVGDHAREIGQAVGAELSRLLAHEKSMGAGSASGGGSVAASGPSAGGAVEIYSLKFENFSANDMMAFERYLVEVFSGYQNHNADKSVGVTHYYTYWTTLDSSHLKRNLIRAIAELNLQGNVSNNANNFTIQKSTLRQQTQPQRSDRW